MPYRFVDSTRTMTGHEETGHILEWCPVTNKIVSDHGFAAEDYRRAGSPQPLPPLVPVIPDDQARARRRSAGGDRRRGSRFLGQDSGYRGTTALCFFLRADAVPRSWSGRTTANGTGPCVGRP